MALLGVLGSLAWDRGSLNTAEQYFKRGIDIADSLDDHETAAYFHVALAEMFNEDDPMDAITHYISSADQFYREDLPEESASAIEDLVELAAEEDITEYLAIVMLAISTQFERS